MTIGFVHMAKGEKMRLIDADALKEKWLEEMIRWSKQTDDYCDGSHWTDVYADFIQELNETPTVDMNAIGLPKGSMKMIAKEMYEQIEKLKEQMILNGFKKTDSVKVFLDQYWMEILFMLDFCLFRLIKEGNEDETD